MKILFPCRLLSGWCAIPDRVAWKISWPKSRWAGPGCAWQAGLHRTCPGHSSVPRTRLPACESSRLAPRKGNRRPTSHALSSKPQLPAGPQPKGTFSLILCPLPRPSGHGGAGGLALRRVCFQGSAALTVQPSLRAALVSPAGREGQRQGLQSPPRSPVPQRLDSLPGTSKSPHPRAAGGCRGVEAARLPSQLCSPDCSSLGTAAPWSDY